MGKGKSDFKDERDAAFLKSFREAYSSINYKDCGGDMMGAAIKMAINAPQPRHWLSFWGVYRIVSSLKRGQHGKRKGIHAKEIEREIAMLYEKVRQKRIHRDKSVYELTSFIIAEPAIGFYITEGYARRLISKLINGK